MIWNATTGARERVYDGHAQDERKEHPLFAGANAWDEEWLRGVSSVHHLAWSAESTFIASAGLRTVCCVWNAATGETLAITNCTSGPIAWSCDGTSLLVLPNDPHNIHLWDYRTNTLQAQYDFNNPQGITHFAVAANGTSLAVDAGGHIRLWRLGASS
jgi:WD40 repeat protein